MLFGKRAAAPILFVVSGESIAHTLRPLPIARTLRDQGWRVAFGGQGRYLPMVAAAGFDVVPLPTLPYPRVLEWQARLLHRIYRRAEIPALVAAQRAAIAAFAPAVIVQDGPDSTLPIAAHAAGVPVLAISNASVIGLAGRVRYTPFHRRLHGAVQRLPQLAPPLDRTIELLRMFETAYPIGHFLGQQRIGLAETAYRQQLLPDLRELFFDAADSPGRVFIGPLLYEPPVARPAWWRRLDRRRPLVYAAIGSSGGAVGLDVMVAALADQPLQVVLSTAGAVDVGALPKNFLASPLVPRAEVLARAAVMVFHGGNATMYQAIRHRVPMVAIPGHFDHDLNARAIVRAGLGRSILPLDLTPDGLRQAVTGLIDDAAVHARLEQLGRCLDASDGPGRGAELVAALATTHARARATPYGGAFGRGRGGAPWRRSAAAGGATS
jgi:MGT family glycosyltransferase